MATYTAIDMSNATKYVNERYKLRLLNYLYKTRPNIISWLDVKITAADPEIDYYYPANFADKAIKVTITLTEHACKTVNCNTTHPRGVCKFDDQPIMYRLGETNTFTSACQPACYHMKTSVTYNEDGKVVPQMVRTKWSKHNNECAILSTVSSYMELPIFRSEERYQRRVNDLRVGFDEYVDENDKLTVSGIQYKFNEYYCRVYDTTFDAQKKTCYNPPGKWLYKNLVGGYMIAMVKAGINMLENGTLLPSIDFDVPVPEPGPELFYENWRKDINPDFVLPSIDITLKDLQENDSYRMLYEERDPEEDPFSGKEDDLDTYVNFTRSKLFKKFSMPVQLRRQHEEGLMGYPSESAKLTNAPESAQKQSISFVRGVDDHILPKLTTESEGGGASNVNDTGNDTGSKPSEEETNWEIVKKWMSERFVMVLQSLFSTEFLEMLAVNKAYELLVQSLKTSLNMVMNKFLPFLIGRMQLYTQMLLTNVVAKSIEALLVRTTMTLAMNMITKTVTFLVTFLTELASFVGVILAIVNIMDLLFSLFDPFGFNQAFSAEFLNVLTFQSELAQRRSMGVARPTITFDLLAGMMISNEEKIKLDADTLLDLYEYMDALTVNSEGARIDKGDVFNPKYIQKDELTTEIFAKKSVYTVQELVEFEETHKLRMSYFTQSKTYLTILLGVALAFVILEIWIGAIIFFLLCLLLLWTNYLNSVINVGKYVKDSQIQLNLK